MDFQLILFLPFSFCLFTFFAFLRGHYPEQVHRVISQLQAEPGLPLPWPIQIFRSSYNSAGNS